VNQITTPKGILFMGTWPSVADLKFGAKRIDRRTGFKSGNHTGIATSPENGPGTRHA